MWVPITTDAYWMNVQFLGITNLNQQGLGYGREAYIRILLCDSTIRGPPLFQRNMKDQLEEGRGTGILIRL